MTPRRPTRWPRRPIALVMGVVMWCLAPPSPARAQPLSVRTTGIAVQGTDVLASVGLQDLFTPAARERLLSGFSTHILIRVLLQREGAPEPVAVAFQRTEILYDIWDEKFRVRIARGAGPDRLIEAATVEQAISAGATLWRFPIAYRTQLQPGQRYFLAVRGDLNPLSPELQAEVRRWLRQPAGTQRRPGSGGGDSFFGSFVTVFVNPQIDDSEHEVRFISQSFPAQMQ